MTARRSILCARGFVFALLLLQSGNARAAEPPGQQAEAPRSAPSVQEIFRHGESALKDGHLDKAEAAFRRVVALDPYSAGAYTNLGVIAMRRQQWEQALRWLHKAEKLAPGEPGIRLNIGLAHYRRGEYASAIPPFESVLRDQPDSLQARYLLGLCNFFVERYADAVKVLEPLWPQQSNDLNYLYVLGNAAHFSGRNDLDERALTQLVSIGKDTAEFHLLMAKAHLNHGDEEATSALNELQRAESINPNLPFLHFNLGFYYLRAGDNERAEAEFLKDVALEPDVPENYEQLGVLYSRIGKNQEAEHYYREALKRDPKLGGSQFGLAQIYLREGKYPPALAAADAAVKLAPNSQQAHFVRSQILLRMERREEAQAEIAIAKRQADAKLDQERKKRQRDSLPNPELTRRPQ
ncbi:MAG: hypothetical protein DMG33_04305 [Acidobacteria bacterium]|nr:MAG: hypothetical protein DMG33_04305 [Acidobacteriota bacterium]